MKTLEKYQKYSYSALETTRPVNDIQVILSCITRNNVLALNNDFVDFMNSLHINISIFFPQDCTCCLALDECGVLFLLSNFVNKENNYFAIHTYI